MAPATKVVAETLGVTPQTVTKWRARFLKQRLDVLFNAPRPGVPRTIDDARVNALIANTLEEQPTKATQWSKRTTARKWSVADGGESDLARVWPAASSSGNLSFPMFFVFQGSNIMPPDSSPAES